MAEVALTWGPQGFGSYRIEGEFEKWQQTPDQPNYVLAPGFVDIHIHGANGMDWMEQPNCLPDMASYLAQIGVEAFYPTTISLPLEVVERAIAEFPSHHPMLPGFHLEGPFLSPLHPGAQPPSALLTATDLPNGWQRILESPHLKVITLASEIPGGLELVNMLARRGVHVSLGHTDATFEQASLAFQAGARGLTHFYNAMRPLHHREAGTVGFGLLENGITCELIYDRVHVSRPAAEVLFRAKPQDGIIAISDGTMASGLAPGSNLKMWGHEVVVGEKDVRLASGGLAGSSSTILSVFQALAQDFGPEVAMRTTSVNPRKTMGLSPVPSRWVELTLDFEFVRVRDQLP